MGHRQKLKDGDEFDCVRARRYYPGSAKGIKRKMNKRARREAMTELTRISEEMGLYEPGLPNPLDKDDFEGF